MNREILSVVSELDDLAAELKRLARVLPYGDAPTVLRNIAQKEAIDGDCEDILHGMSVRVADVAFDLWRFANTHTKNLRIVEAVEQELAMEASHDAQEAA